MSSIPLLYPVPMCCHIDPVSPTGIRVWSSNAVPASPNSLIQPLTPSFYTSRGRPKVRKTIISRKQGAFTLKLYQTLREAIFLFSEPCGNMNLLIVWRVVQVNVIISRWTEAQQWCWGHTGPVACGKQALINRPAGLRAALAPANMMNPHCGSVTANVSDKQKAAEDQRLLSCSLCFSSFLLCSQSWNHRRMNPVLRSASHRSTAQHAHELQWQHISEYISYTACILGNIWKGNNLTVVPQKRKTTTTSSC